jgi:hypothetical protein
MSNESRLGIYPVLPSPEEQAKFDSLASSWEEMHSWEQVTHLTEEPVYHQIVEMGSIAIQPILDRLSNGSVLWFFPLQEIIRRLGEKEVKTKHDGSGYDPNVRYSVFEPERKAYLEWGIKNGYQVKIPEK